MAGADVGAGADAGAWQAAASKGRPSGERCLQRTRGEATAFQGASEDETKRRTCRRLPRSFLGVRPSDMAMALRRAIPVKDLGRADVNGDRHQRG